MITVFFKDGATSVMPASTWHIKNGSLFVEGRRVPLARIEEVRPGVHQHIDAKERA